MKYFISAVLILSLSCVVWCQQSKSLNKSSPVQNNTVIKEKKPLQVSEDDLRFNSTDPIERRKAINDAVFSKDVSKIDLIEKYLYDESKLVRMSAIEGLGILRSTQTADKITDILLNDNDREIKNSCMIALSYIPNVNTKKIIEYYYKETDDILKSQALRLLASKNDRSIEKDMIKVANSSNFSTEIRINAIYYLGVIKSTDAVFVVKKLIENENKLIKLEAIRSAGEIGDKSFIDILKARAMENDDDIKIESVFALAKLGDNSLIELVHKYINSSNLSYRDKSLTAMGMVGDKKTMEFLEGYIGKVEDPALKSFISFTIERIKARIKK